MRAAFKAGLLVLTIGCQDSPPHAGSSPDPEGRPVELTIWASLESSANDTTGPGGSPVLAMPVYPLVSPDSSVWIVDAGQQRVVHYRPNLEDSLVFIGGPGRGPREFAAPAGIDYAEDGVWVADIDNARLSRIVNDSIVSIKPVNDLPLGIATGPDDLWVVTPNTTALLAIYDLEGNRRASVGTPLFAERDLIRYNQAVMTRGNPPGALCRVAVAFNFLPLVRCYSSNGSLAWEAESPGESRAEWQHAVLDGERASTDMFAYLDVSQTGDLVLVASMCFAGSGNWTTATTSPDRASNTCSSAPISPASLVGGLPAQRPREAGLIATVSYDPVPRVTLYALPAALGGV